MSADGRPPCGTNRGYQSHRYHNEDACAECLIAHADYHRVGPPDNPRSHAEREADAVTLPDPIEVSVGAILRLLDQVEDWRDLAACAGIDSPDVFFPGAGQTGNRALAICARCAVRDQCLADALDGPVRYDQGVRGGLTEDERVSLRRRKARTA